MTKYNLYDRIYDDNGNDIGIVIGFQKVSNSLPEEYTELEYIESSGTQWIEDTTLVNDFVTGAIEVKLDLSRSNSGRFVGFTPTGSATSDRYTIFGSLAVIASNHDIAMCYSNYNQWSDKTDNNIDLTKVSVVKYEFASGLQKLYIDGNYNRESTFTASPTATNYTFKMFKIHKDDGYQANARVYYAKVYKGTELVRYYIPAKRNSDDVLGMYEVKTGIFLTNQGTGTFITGPETIDYAIVCLNAKYRTFGDILSGNDNVTVGKCWGYNSVMNMTDSGTYETQKILDFIVSNPSYTSSGAMYARNQIFSIDDVTYRAQLPNFPEALKISKNIKRINEEDPSASTYSNKLIPVITNTSTAAEQMYASFGSTTWYQQNKNGEVTSANNIFQIKPLGMSDASNRSQTAGKLIVPILELPLEEVTPTPSQKYKLFDRVKDTNNNEIGTVSGFITKKTEGRGLPKGYTELEYIESNGEGIFNTGVIPGNSVLKIDYDFQYLSFISHEYNTVSFMGCGNDFAHAGGGVQVGVEKVNDAYWFFNMEPGTNMNRFQVVTTNRVSGSWVINGTTSTSVLTGDLQDNITSSAHFGNNTAWRSEQIKILSGYLIGRLFSTKIYLDNVIVRDFVPAKRNSDGVLGIYDLTNNQFYTNSLGGTFIAGPDVTFNTIEYAVVCLDAKDRALDKAIFSDNAVQIQGITSLNANSTITPYELTETATDNTDALLATATATSKTSEAATFVRTKLYSIGGNVYYGQIPTIKELTDILMNYSTINLLDTTSGNYSNYIIKDLYQSKRSSSQYFNNGSGYTFNWNWDGIMAPSISNTTTRYDSHDTLLIPVLEIPNI